MRRRAIAAGSAALLALGLGAACGGVPRNAAGQRCGDEERPGMDGRCAYATPIAVIRYALELPHSDLDYSFGADAPPTIPAALGATLYLSSEHSVGFEGAAVAAVWSVLDPTGEPVEVLPFGSAQVSFVATRRGEYSIALEVHALDDRALTGTSVLHVPVGPARCAADGISLPCAAADRVPAGRYLMGSTDEDASASPEHPATVSEFALDRFEVTVGRFRRFLDAYPDAMPAPGAGAHPQINGSGWQPDFDLALPGSRQQFELAFADCGGTWDSNDPARDALPINCVSWHEAFAFCIWDHGRLPTEAEWEYAAAGGDEARRYPWGDAEPGLEQAIFGCLFDQDPSCDDADLPPGGNATQGAGRFGQQDLAGSLWEWTLDEYAPYGAGECVDCALLDGGEGRVFRGGSFRSDDRSELRAVHRLGFLAEQRDVTRGFRCARSSPTGE